MGPIVINRIESTELAKYLLPASRKEQCRSDRSQVTQVKEASVRKLHIVGRWTLRTSPGRHPMWMKRRNHDQARPLQNWQTRLNVWRKHKQRCLGTLMHIYSVRDELHYNRMRKNNFVLRGCSIIYTLHQLIVTYVQSKIIFSTISTLQLIYLYFSTFLFSKRANII